MIYLISDEHYGHEKVIEFGSRPFKNGIEMNEQLIKNFQITVNPDDLIYHLGDFGLCNRQMVNTILAQLPGKHILIMGNHDRQQVTGANWTAVLSQAVLPLGKHRFLLNHRPKIELPDDIDGVFHGHVHSPKRDRDYPNLAWFNVNLSVEQIEYRPISLKKAL